MSRTPARTPARKRIKPLFRTETEQEERGGEKDDDDDDVCGTGQRKIVRKRRRPIYHPPSFHGHPLNVDDPLNETLITGADENILNDGVMSCDGGQVEEEEEEEDLLNGLCPEDLNFSFNSSSYCHHSIPPGPSSIPPETSMEPGQDAEVFRLSQARKEEKGKGGGGEERGRVRGGGGRGGGGGGEETFFGLPLTVKSLLEEHRAIKQLYAWQEECLKLPSVQEGGNLIYCLPTGGGKTLVAEILTLRQLLLHKNDVLLILPYVSIVQEKVRDLTPFSLSLEFVVEEYAAGKGKTPPIKRRRKRVVYVATIEKASGLVNSLAELDRLSEIGLTVVDELHMIGDGGVRGAALESCLTKILHLSRGTQMIGMSATLSNISDLAAFLRAQTFSSHFRPVELKEYVKIGRSVYVVRSSPTGSSGGISLSLDRHLTQEERTDPDQLVSLVVEVLPQPCLIFCSTKRRCQNAALHLTKHLHKFHAERGDGPRSILLKSLAVEAQGVCPILNQTIPVGVAYHHSGLMADERKLIEDAFSNGILNILCSTSTLAAGVNLPARRVILRSPYIGGGGRGGGGGGGGLLSHSQYKQMIGRAGRKGLSETGESILMTTPTDKDKVKNLLSSPCDHCSSSLMCEGATVLHSLILSLLALELVKSTSDLQTFLKATLYYQQTRDHTHFLSCCQDIVTNLVANGYITMVTEEDKLNATPLGIAVMKGNIPVQRAGQVYKELINAQSSLILSTKLHLLFLTTPTDHASSIRPNWLIFFQMLTGMEEKEMKVAEMVGVSPCLLGKLATGSVTNLPKEQSLLYQRFYLCLMMYRLISNCQRSPGSGGVASETEGVWSVAKQFQCSRGYIQSSLNSMASYATCLVHFTEELSELWALHLLLPSVAELLSLSASFDLAPLLDIPGVRQGRARQLLQAGYSTPESLAGVSPVELCEKVHHLYPKQAWSIIQGAKAVLRDKAEILFEEAEDLVSGLS